MRDVTVCVATHKRPDGLRKLLESLSQQTDAPSFDIVVVDNDSAQSAGPIITEFKDRLPITYLTEPVRGLSRVRNRAVGAADASFLAFVDDDEWATPHWLADLLGVAQDTNADVVIGPVRIVFGPGVQPYVQACRFFTEAGFRDGEILPWYATRTSNALVRRSSLPDLPAPFGARFDLSGGEDVDLFRRMIDAGANVRASSSALVFEYRPASRANLGWIVRRAIRNGATIADIEWRQMPAGQRFRRAVRTAAGAIVPAWQAGVHWRRDRAGGLNELIIAAEGIGKLAHLCGIQIQEYRVHS